jgi:hypothetical protein
MKQRIRSVVAVLMLGISLAYLPAADATVANDQQTVSYETKGSDAQQVANGIHGIRVPSSEALGLIVLAMIGLIAIGRRI